MSTAKVLETKILRRCDVEKRVGLSRSTIYLLIAENRFPAPIRLSTRAVGWVEADVEAWIDSKRN
jgi:prophage regulatory protein